MRPGSTLAPSLTATAGAGHRLRDGTAVEAQPLHHGAAPGPRTDRVALLAAGRLLQASPLVDGAPAIPFAELGAHF
jgi:hypothetical protein